MEKNIRKTTEVLNDLIKINNERIEGYKKVSSVVAGREPDLTRVFTDMIDQSSGFLSMLRTEIKSLDETADKDINKTGSIYRRWIDEKASYVGNNRHSILNSCEHAEAAMQKVYDQALEEDIAQTSISLILIQKSELRDAYNLVRKLLNKELVHS